MKQQKNNYINGKKNKQRKNRDTAFLKVLKGEKYRLPEELQVDIMEESRKDRQWLKNKFGIDYGDAELMAVCEEDFWQEETLDDLRSVMNKFNAPMRYVVVNFFRDRALACEEVDLEKAYRLMRFCHEMRPQGPLISNKLEQYKSLCFPENGPITL